jgi:hypothetical protein
LNAQGRDPASPDYAVTGHLPAKGNVGGRFSVYRKKIFVIKEDICYLVASVAGQRGRLLF